MKRWRLALLAIVPLLVCVAAYSVAYSRRVPAANLAYFAYTDHAPSFVERTMLYGFYPVYYIHSRVFSGQKHVWDRPRPVDVPNA